MKRLLNVILCVFVLFAFAACGNETVDESSSEGIEKVESNTESEESVYAGKTKKLVSKQVNKNGTGEITQTTEYEYDEKGRISVAKNTFDNGSNCIYTSYDENGYEAESITKDASGSIIAHHQFERDEYGYMLKWRILDKNGNVKNENIYDIVRDKQDRLLEIYSNGELSQYYSYDENGNATERRPNSDSYRIYDKNEKTLESGSSDYKMVYTYENGRLAEINSQNSETVFKIVYEYDGELLLSQTNYENGEVTLKYISEYDKDGDIIKYTMQNALGIATSITEYFYEEFPIEE